MPAWLTEPPPTEAHHRIERSEEKEHARDVRKDQDSAQQCSKLERKHPLANPAAWDDMRKCRDVKGLYDWAATYELDVKKYSRLLFVRMCHLGLPLSVRLRALEDAVLGTVGNLNFLLDWQLRKQEEGRLHNRLKSDDIALLQEWMKQQFACGLKSEEEIIVFLRFISRLSDANDVDESLLLNLIASFEGLQSSSILGFKDLGAETQLSILGFITQGPVTRQMLEMGLRFVEDMPRLELMSKSEKKAAFIAGVIRAHTLRREHDEHILQTSEIMPTILKTIWNLPLASACSVIFITTKALVDDHLRMPSSEAAVVRLPDAWLSALAQERLFRRKFYLRGRVEDFLGAQKQEVAVPYLQHLGQRKKVSFIIRHWIGPRSRLSRSQVRYTSDEPRPASEKEPTWMSVFRTIREGAPETRELRTNVKEMFKKLQMSHQSETIIQIVKQARNSASVIEPSDVLYAVREHLDDQPKLAERLFRLCPPLGLECCPELAEQLILDPENNPDNALRYVRERSRFIGPWSELWHEGVLGARIKLLGRMALAYSMALHLPARVALRYVSKCYYQHRKERLGPVPVALARAFTLAGLIRPLKNSQRISPDQVGEILSFIRSVEGGDVGDRVHEAVYQWRGIILKEIKAAFVSQSM